MVATPFGDMLHSKGRATDGHQQWLLLAGCGNGGSDSSDDSSGW